MHRRCEARSDVGSLVRSQIEGKVREDDNLNLRVAVEMEASCEI